MKMQGGDTCSWPPRRSSGSTYPVSNSTSGDATTPNPHLKKASTEVRPDNLLSSFTISSQQTRNLVIPYLVVVPRFSNQYQAPRCQPLSVQALSVNFKKVTFLSLDSSTGSSSSSRSLCFRMSTIWPTARSWPREFSNSMISPASDALICVFGLIY
jgi:hypothetical protein